MTIEDELIITKRLEKLEQSISRIENNSPGGSASRSPVKNKMARKKIAQKKIDG